MKKLPFVLATLLVTIGINGCVIAPRIALLNGPESSQEKVVRPGGSDKVLLLDLTGLISSTSSQSLLGIGSSTNSVAHIDAALNTASKDKNVKAVVLQINTPGGGVTASDEIYARISRFRQESNIPVIAALGDIAASGGYYAACAADELVMHPTGITGSIGVVLSKYDISELLNKIGVADDGFQAGRMKKLLSQNRAATPEEAAIVQNLIDEMHQRFISVVVQNRPALKKGKLSEITDGRVFSATQALELGVIDKIGRLDDAITRAEARANIKNAKIVRYSNPGISGNSIHANSSSNSANAASALVAMPSTAPRLLYLWPAAL